MVQQLSTSASDALLTLSVLYLIYIVFWENFFAAVGVAIQGATAILGIVRFVQTRPRSQLCEYHQMMSWLAQVLDKHYLFIFQRVLLLLFLCCFYFVFLLAPAVIQIFTNKKQGFHTIK